MSEYQYYEFQAIDRPLSGEEMAALRGISTRATITPARFVNVYHYGDLSATPLDMLARYFDAFVYVANWGTRQFMLRLPRRLIATEAVAPYIVDDALDLHARGDNVILEFISRDEEGGGWVDDEESAGWMPALLPLRADLAAGDRRALYLGWLAAANGGALEDEEPEPPVPPGLGKLSAPLASLARFLGVDDDLIAVAAERSAAPVAAGPAAADLERWIRDLPEAEKNDVLLRLARGDQALLQAELLRRFRQVSAATEPVPAAADGGRTVGELVAAAAAGAEGRRRREAEQKAAARAAYLDTLVAREEDVWRQVEALIDAKRPTEYDQSMRLLQDLRELSERVGTVPTYAARLRELRARHAKKPAFIQRLNAAKLNG